MDNYADLKQGEKGAWLSIGAYILLSAFKIIMGITTNSEALRADGLNNATDIVASVAVLIGLRISSRPPDEDHPYGHRRAETIAALVASFVMFVVGLDVIRNGVMSFFADEIAQPDLMAAWVAIACAVVMYGIYLYNFRLAIRINNKALQAAAKDNRSDAWVSVGTFAGVLGAQFGAAWLDPLAATLVGVLICKTAYDIFRESSHSLTDGYADEEHMRKLRESIHRTSGVQGVRDMKARMHGNRIMLDVTIEVAAEMSVKEGHDIAESIERMMRKKHHIHHAHIHVEPKEV